MICSLIELRGESDLQLLPNLVAGVAVELREDSFRLIELQHRLRLVIVNFQSFQKNLRIVVRSLRQRLAGHVVSHWNLRRVELEVVDTTRAHVDVTTFDPVWKKSRFKRCEEFPKVPMLTSDDLVGNDQVDDGIDLLHLPQLLRLDFRPRESVQQEISLDSLQFLEDATNHRLIRDQHALPDVLLSVHTCWNRNQNFQLHQLQIFHPTQFSARCCCAANPRSTSARF